MQLQSHNIVQNKSSIGTVDALPEFTIKNLIALQQLNQKLVENEEARAQFVSIFNSYLWLINIYINLFPLYNDGFFF